jgi:hypothetical protein
MTEEEARTLLRARGWTWRVRIRTNGLPYLYAIRREKRKMVERYIGPLSQLPQMTEADIVAKLTRS